MATIGTANPTLADVAKRLDPGGKIDKIVELLNQQNEMLADITWIEGNLPTGHKTTVRTGLPSVAWRMLNYGVPQSKSRTVQVTDTAGMLEAYAEVDKDLAMLNGNTAEFRLSEDRAFIEAMNQEFADTFFYGNTDTDPEKFLGLSPRYATLTADDTSANVINGDYGGVAAGANQTSIWLVVWGPNTVHGIYPKGSVAGLTHQDLGEQTLTDSAGGMYQGLRSHYQWKCGLTVRDWRYVIRVANIDLDLLTVSATPDPDLIRLMVDALETVQDLNMGRPVFYVNKTVRQFLRHHQRLSSNVNLGIDTVMGKKCLVFDGVPIRRNDALTFTEDKLL